MSNKIIYRSFVFVIALLTIQTISAQKRPSWTYNTPDAPNSTFVYRVEWGAGKNIIVAYNQALTKIINSTANSIGVNTSTGAIKDALESGQSFDVVSETLKVPFNKVCEFEENLGGGLYRVFVLCQAAKNANIKPEFVVFNDCYNADEMTGTNLESEEQKAERRQQALLKQQEAARKAEQKKKEEARKKAYPKVFEQGPCLFNITKVTRRNDMLEVHGLVQNQASEKQKLWLRLKATHHPPKAYTSGGNSYTASGVQVGDRRSDGHYGPSVVIPSGVTLRFKYTFNNVSQSFDALSVLSFNISRQGEWSDKTHTIKNLPITDM